MNLLQISIEVLILSVLLTGLIRFWPRIRVELNLPSTDQQKKMSIDVNIPKENLTVQLDTDTIDALEHLKKLNMSDVKIPPVEIKTERKSTSMAIDNPKRFDIQKLKHFKQFNGALCVIRDNGLSEDYLCFLSDTGTMSSVGNLVDA